MCNKCKSIFIYFVMSKNMDIVQCNGYETNKRLLTLHVVVGVGHKVIVYKLRDELFLTEFKIWPILGRLSFMNFLYFS